MHKRGYASSKIGLSSKLDGEENDQPCQDVMVDNTGHHALKEEKTFPERKSSPDRDSKDLTMADKMPTVETDLPINPTETANENEVQLLPDVEDLTEPAQDIKAEERKLKGSGNPPGHDADADVEAADGHGYGFDFLVEDLGATNSMMNQTEEASLTIKDGEQSVVKHKDVKSHHNSQADDDLPEPESANTNRKPEPESQYATMEDNELRRNYEMKPHEVLEHLL